MNGVGGEFTDRGTMTAVLKKKRTTLSRSGGAEQGEREKEAGFQAGTGVMTIPEFRDEETEKMRIRRESKKPSGRDAALLKRKNNRLQDWNGCAVLVVLKSSAYLFARREPWEVFLGWRSHWQRYLWCWDWDGRHDMANYAVRSGRSESVLPSLRWD